MTSRDFAREMDRSRAQVSIGDHSARTFRRVEQYADDVVADKLAEVVADHPGSSLEFERSGQYVGNQPPTLHRECRKCLINEAWRGGRAVEGTGLENRQG